MKTVGIVGGIAPASTIEYYRFIIDSYREQNPNGSYPSILINSINLTKVLDLVKASRWPELIEYLSPEVQRLARAGADFAVFASNTPHIVFDDLQKRSPIPLISIVQATCDAAKAMGARKLGLFGTRFTMQGRVYLEVFARAGIALVVPDEADQAYIHDHYMDELANSIFLPETRDGMLAIAARLRARENIEGLILGGTELPILLREGSSTDFPFLDTTQIHVKSIVAELLR
jgi:aspartate racemase